MHVLNVSIFAIDELVSAVSQACAPSPATVSPDFSCCEIACFFSQQFFYVYSQFRYTGMYFLKFKIDFFVKNCVFNAVMP
jgi:hypothetical protein